MTFGKEMNYKQVIKYEISRRNKAIIALKI